MKKNILFGIMIIVLVVIMGFFLLSKNTTTQTENNLGTKAQTQIVKLSVENGRYIMNPSTVKKGDLVRIEADIAKMPGCSKSVVISAFNVRKTVNQNDNIIEFTPDKAGTFNIACSMNMYKGTFTVLESDGTKPAYVEQTSQSQTGGSCGMGANGGSCGCRG
jgi:plastocyanin domain-containing protein